MLKIWNLFKSQAIEHKFDYINEIFINTEAYYSFFPQNNNICLDFGKLNSGKKNKKVSLNMKRIKIKIHL